MIYFMFHFTKWFDVIHFIILLYYHIYSIPNPHIKISIIHLFCAYVCIIFNYTIPIINIDNFIINNNLDKILYHIITR